MRRQRNLRNLAICSQLLAGLLTGLLIGSSGAALGFQTPTKSSVTNHQVKDLRIIPGKLLIQGENNIPVGPLGLLTYKLEEIPLERPVDIIVGKKQRIETAIRLTLTGNSISRAHVIWINDARLTGVWSNGPRQIGTLIYDRSILQAGTTISVQDNEDIHSLPEVLRLPDTFPTPIVSDAQKGNEIVSIRRVLRITGSEYQPLVQIEMRTNCRFPVRNAALQLQIGKQFFSKELGIGPDGSWLIVSLTPQVFAELKDGADVLAGFSFNRGGGESSEFCYFGRLKKAMFAQ